MKPVAWACTYLSASSVEGTSWCLQDSTPSDHYSASSAPHILSVDPSRLRFSIQPTHSEFTPLNRQKDLIKPGQSMSLLCSVSCYHFLLIQSPYIDSQDHSP